MMSHFQKPCSKMKLESPYTADCDATYAPFPGPCDVPQVSRFEPPIETGMQPLALPSSKFWSADTCQGASLTKFGLGSPPSQAEFPPGNLHWQRTLADCDGCAGGKVESPGWSLAGGKVLELIQRSRAGGKVSRFEQDFNALSNIDATLKPWTAPALGRESPNFYDFDVSAQSPAMGPISQSPMEALTEMRMQGWSDNIHNNVENWPEFQDKEYPRSSRWWTSSSTCVACPISGFPIKFLPYPPFKLRVDPDSPWPHFLVDGKFLAMQLITSGSLFVNGRCLQPQEVTWISEYMQKSKLGRLRPSMALELARKAASPQLPERERSEAAHLLNKFRADAKSELQKLRRIQEQRLSQLHDEANGGPAPQKKPPRRRQRAHT